VEVFIEREIYIIRREVESHSFIHSLAPSHFLPCLMRRLQVVDGSHYSFIVAASFDRSFIDECLEFLIDELDCFMLAPRWLGSHL
jgi:hypothetical protein